MTGAGDANHGAVVEDHGWLRANPSGFAGDLLCQGGWYVRAGGIDIDLAQTGNNDQIHVFHGDGPQQGFVPHHHGAGKAMSVFKLDFDRAAIRHRDAMAVGQRDFTFFEFPQVELNGKVLGQAQVQGASIDQRQGLDRL